MFEYTVILKNNVISVMGTVLQSQILSNHDLELHIYNGERLVAYFKNPYGYTIRKVDEK